MRRQPDKGLFVSSNENGRKSLVKVGAAVAMLVVVAVAAVGGPLPSTLAEDTVSDEPTNAYHNGYSVNVRVGGAFADIYSRTSGARYDTDNVGYCFGPDGKSSLDNGWLSTDEAKKYEDGTVMNVPLPSVVARPGYTFVGWVDEKGMHEPKWDAQTKVIQVEIPSDPTLRTTTIFAEFMDDQGNGYCSCGASEAGFFKGSMDELKAKDDSTANEGQAFLKRNLPIVYLLVAEAAIAACVFINRGISSTRKCVENSSVPATEENVSNDTSHDVCDDTDDGIDSSRKRITSD